MRTGRPPQAEPEPRTFASGTTAAIARVIDEAAARGATAETQAEQVLDGLDRRGLLRGAPAAARYFSTTAETHTHGMQS